MVVTSRVQTQIAVEPITPYLGAVISDVDTRADLDDQTIERLKALLVEYKVLFFREQHLSYEEQEHFAGQFGPPRVDPLEDCVPDHPGLALLDNVPFFHADWMNAEDPPKWSILQLTTVPPVGGDTMFVDLVGSYEALSEPYRQFLETLSVYQSIPSYDGDGTTLAKSSSERRGGDYNDVYQRVQPRVQSLVRYIPETGRKNYWISRTYTRRIEGLLPGESESILQFLFNHQLLPQYVIRWNWHAGDLAFWDHRTTLHSGVKDYGDFERHGCRASIAGGRLIPVNGRER